MKQTVDYAIVSRFYCPTTEGPVVVIAGISSNGTEAGGEFMASPEKLAALARYAHSSLDKNFEAVLKVEVVGGDTGAATPVAIQFGNRRERFVPIRSRMTADHRRCFCVSFLTIFLGSGR